MNLYKLTLKHDNGRFNIITSAPSEEIAKYKIMEAENCPACAITKVKLIKVIY